MLNPEGFRLHDIEAAKSSGCGSEEFSYKEKMMKLEVLPLNQHTFSAYGDVIETHKRDFFISMMGWLNVITIWLMWRS